MLKTIVFCVVSVTLLLPFSRKGMAQVANNNISSRSQLVLDEAPIISTTNNSNVEWQCVNKKLTNKCLIYHNDQWFTFTPPVNGKYYINLSAGNCKDNRGIQAIVIQGNPCEISTYKIRKCISQIRFLDSFIEMDSMEANMPYLINIDGFLADYCEFSIQFSSHPTGVSVDGRAGKRLDLSSQTGRSVQILSWKLPMSLSDSIVSFSIFRKPNHQQISEFRGLIPLEINAKGEHQYDYTYVDSVESRKPYSYQVVGDMIDNRQVVLDEFFTSEIADRNGDFRISFSLDNRDKSKLQILLMDAVSDVVLGQRTFAYNEALDMNQAFHVRNYVEKGVSNFKVLVVDLKTRRKREMLYFVDKHGKVTTR